jgi:PAS domain S-box-containing protein
MKYINLGSIGKNLTLLVILAVLPALATILYSGLEQRRHSIEGAKRDVLFLAQTMAEVQKGITNSTRQILSTLAHMPEIRKMDSRGSSEIFRAVIEQNPDYLNISATDINGEVFASALPFTKSNLADRKHIWEALANKGFAAGEYVVTRVGETHPAFTFAHPVLDNQGIPKAVLTIALKLERFAHFFEVAKFPENSFLAVTDHHGIRLFYYPFKEDTNPIGQPILSKVWERAQKAEREGIFIHHGSDGVRRVFAFYQIRLGPDKPPYMYMWAGIPEAHVFRYANLALARNLALMLLAILIALTVSWLIGRNTLISPIKHLLITTQSFADGNFNVRSKRSDQPREIAALANAFDDMANALAESQETLRTIADYTYDWECWLLPDGRLQWVSPSCKKITGYTADEFIADQGLMHRIVYQEDFPLYMRHVKEIESGEGYAKNVDFRIVHRSGHLVWIDHHCILISRADGTSLGRRVSNRDITGRKIMEKALQDSEEQFRFLVEGAPYAIFVQTDYDFAYTNSAAIALFGAASDDELLGEPLLDRIHPDFREQVLECIQIINDQKQFIPGIEMVSLRLDGSQVPVEMSAVPIAYEGKDGALVFLQDISKRKLTDKEKEKLQIQLSQAQKMESVGRLAGGVAHDFNNMLGVIIGHAEMAIDQVDTSQPLYEDLLEIQKAAQRSADLTRQLLAFARKQTINPRVLDLNDTVSGIFKMLRRIVGENIELVWKPGLNLWPVMMDPSQIDQILANLTVNARDAIKLAGNLTIATQNIVFDKTYCSAHAGFMPGEYVLLAVSDNGCGMDKMVLDNLFEPFFTTKGVGKGTGLGLATIYGIVKQNNGFINVYSEPGEGTSFKIYLPRIQTSETVKIEATEPEPSCGAETVLLVEDEETILRLGKMILERYGYTVLVAPSPTEALILAKEHQGPIHMLLTDVVMPGMNGKELKERISAIIPEIRVLFMSGYTADVIAYHGVIEEDVQYLQKPFSVKTLAAKVREVLERKKSNS